MFPAATSRRPSLLSRELALVLAAAAAVSVTLAGLSSLPTRFVLAAALGAGFLVVWSMVENKRMYLLTWLTLTLAINISKRLVIIQGLFPDRPDSFALSVPDIFIIMGYAFWAWELLGGSEPMPALRRTLAVPFAVLVFSTMFSFVNTSYPAWGAAEIFRMAKTFLLYWYVAHNVRNIKEARWLLLCLGAGLFLQLAVCLVQKYAGESLSILFLSDNEKNISSFAGERVVSRAGGTFGHPNYFAYYLDLLIPMMLSLGFSTALNAWRRFYFIFALLAGCACLMLTVSRGGILATGLSASLCFTVLVARNMRLGVFKFQTAAVVMGGLLVAAIFSGDVIERFTKKDAGALDTRFYQYQVATKIFEDNTWFGVGLNSYKNIAPRYDDTPVKIATTFKAPVHNVYFLTLTETGVVGALGLLILVLAILNLAWYGRWPYGEVYELHLGLFFGVVGYLIHANVDINPIGSYTIIFFLLGFITAAQRFGAASAAGAASDLRRAA